MRISRTQVAVGWLVPALCIWFLSGQETRTAQALEQTAVAIRLNYTYAELPFAGMTPGQVQQVGKLQVPEGDQDKNFRSIFASAAAVITAATRNKVRFEGLDYVSEVLSADVIVSLNGGSGRTGWATPGAFGDQPGQVGLYYQSLAKEREEDAILIVAHLLSHYLFDLPDELDQQETRAACPKQNPDGPGCLMDNFLSAGPRWGYYGKFCGDKDHNPDAPVSATLSAEHAAKESCQFRINQFLRRNGVSGDISASSAPTDRFQSLEIAARSYTRSMMQKNKVGINRRTQMCSSEERSQLQNLSRKFLEEQLAYMSRDPDFHDRLGPNDLPEAVDRVVDSILLEPVPSPPNFDRYLIESLGKKASQQAAQLLAGQAANPGAGRVSGSNAQIEAIVQGVKAQLMNYLLRLNQGAFVISETPGPNSILPQDERFIEVIARKATLRSLPASAAG